ncbi:hypothetical protein MAR_037555, partial [Mya arenaria]
MIIAIVHKNQGTLLIIRSKGTLTHPCKMFPFIFLHLTINIGGVATWGSNHSGKGLRQLGFLARARDSCPRNVCRDLLRGLSLEKATGTPDGVRFNLAPQGDDIEREACSPGGERDKGPKTDKSVNMVRRPSVSPLASFGLPEFKGLEFCYIVMQRYRIQRMGLIWWNEELVIQHSRLCREGCTYSNQIDSPILEGQTDNAAIVDLQTREVRTHLKMDPRIINGKAKIVACETGHDFTGKTLAHQMYRHLIFPEHLTRYMSCTTYETIVYWPDRESSPKTMPMQFREHFVFIYKPSNMLAWAETWSSYKHHTTVKFLKGLHHR